MSYVYFNPNPTNKDVGDCVVRAFAAATDTDWDTAFLKLTLRAYVMHDMPSSNAVWDAQLISEGFKREVIPNTCPDCYTVKQFANEHRQGTFVLGTGTHAVAVIDGDYYDAWDSGNKVPIYFYYREEN
jgi:hypothetical protein